MITENLSTLKIHKLTQEQYDRELAAGRIDENALYLTPDEGTDLNGYATEGYVDSAVGAISALVGDTSVSKQISDAITSVKLTLDADGVLVLST